MVEPPHYRHRAGNFIDLSVSGGQLAASCTQRRFERHHAAPLCLSSQSGNGATSSKMEIVSIEAKIVDSLVADLSTIADEADSLCATKDYYLQEWLDNQDVCSILKVSKRTLQTYRDNGKLPFTQIDRKMYYKPADIESLLSSIRQNGQQHYGQRVNHNVR
jgi:hypothetical protein